jgi:hypothetical protein
MSDIFAPLPDQSAEARPFLHTVFTRTPFATLLTAKKPAEYQFRGYAALAHHIALAASQIPCTLVTGSSHCSVSFPLVAQDAGRAIDATDTIDAINANDTSAAAPADAAQQVVNGDRGEPHSRRAGTSGGQ